MDAAIVKQIVDSVCRALHRELAVTWSTCPADRQRAADRDVLKLFNDMASCLFAEFDRAL